MTMAPEGFAAAALEMYGSQLVEIHTGESHSTLKLDQEDISIKHVIRGTIVGAIGPAILVKCDVPGGHKTLMVNSWSVSTIAAVNEPGLLKDCYFDEHSSRNV